MDAMVFDEPGRPLQLKKIPVPRPLPDQVLVKVLACGICRTDLHILDGDLKQPKLPLVPGHEIIGIVVKTGTKVTMLRLGDVVGIPWLAHTCGRCRFCLQGRENLCDSPLFTGYTLDGGFARYAVAYEQFAFPMPPLYQNPSGAPLMCAGLIGYRAYSMIPEHSQTLGLYGFGAAAHILIQIARAAGKKVYVFTRKDDRTTQQFARDLGAVWAGSSDESPPVKLDAAIIFAPDGRLIPHALQNVDKGGVVVCGGIHMSDVPGFPYRILWEERMIRSVANLTRQDGELFLELAPRIPVTITTTCFPLEQANEAIDLLRSGSIRGAAVLVMDADVEVLASKEGAMGQEQKIDDGLSGQVTVQNYQE
ncbi:MAG TPA: zinc-dependent alcohol dehydrogenase family protein [Sphingobacteriaceae bacterium]